MRNLAQFPRIDCTDVDKQPISRLNPRTRRLSAHVGRKPGPLSDWRKPCRTRFRPGITRSRRTWSIKGAAEAIEFYKRAFGAKELSRMPFPGKNGQVKLGHAELQDRRLAAVPVG